MTTITLLATALATLVTAAAAAEPQSGTVLFQLPPGPIALTNTDPKGIALKSFVLPIERLRGTRVSLSALIKAQDISAKPQPWNGVKLHSPPGGKPIEGGYVAAMGDFFTRREAQQHFVAVWQKMARRYRGNAVIWGFDLVNEPVDDQTAAGCQDWQSLALTAAKAVREIDPERILIIEPPRWGSPSGFEDFNPLPLPRVVYSFHMYEPTRFTHQRVYDKQQPRVRYPGQIDGQRWNRDRLVQAMEPAIRFARKYRVHLYVGEFSAIRWAPGADRYLADLTSIFEEHGWDWSYHAFREWSGWSLECGSDEHDDRPVTQPTLWFAVIERWFQQNQPAAIGPP